MAAESTAISRCTVLSRWLLLAVSLTVACGGNPATTVTGPPPPLPRQLDPLRKVIADRGLKIGIGTAIGSLFNNTTDPAAGQYMTVLTREFNVITPENDMKFGPLRPAQNQFRFVRADSMVAFAAANGMKVRGHTLVWHQQLASWLTGGSWTTDQVKALLDEHITTVVSHYKGQLSAWDVVNEAFDDDGGARTASFWYSKIGSGYVEQAFKTARAADPDTPLFYNDYNIEGMNAKSDAVYAMLADFKARGVPVDGIGVQMHLIAGALPPLASIQQNFARLAGLGLKIHITELDVRMNLPATQEMLATQAQNYRDVFNICLQQSACEMVVMWGFTDRSSWVPGTFPGQGDALIFDSSFQPKPAYTAINNLLAGK